MEEFIYVLTPTRPAMLTAGPTDEEQAAVAAHFAYLQEYAAQGTVRLAGRTTSEDETTFGIVILKTKDAGEATHLMVNDPAVSGGVMSARLHPFRIALEG